MSLVVFLRGANVGGTRVFRPSALARDLAPFGVVNVGAAGTFVVHGAIGRATLRAEILRRLPFEAELMICRGGELTSLAREQPFPAAPTGRGLRRLVSVMARRPRAVPPLPFGQPGGDQWQVRVIGVSGRFALSLWRRLGRSLVDPNGVVERSLGVSATTRNWNTISAICRQLEARGTAPPAGGRGAQK